MVAGFLPQLTMRLKVLGSRENGNFSVSEVVLSRFVARIQKKTTAKNFPKK